jgi:hypothetical protein
VSYTLNRAVILSEASVTSHQSRRHSERSVPTCFRAAVSAARDAKPKNLRFNGLCCSSQNERLPG